MDNRKLATIRKVDSLERIDGADFIEMVRIGGWQCVAKKGEFKPSDLCVYFEVDSFLPVEERYDFLRKSSYKKVQDSLQGGRAEGFRLKTARLRNTLSQGLALPLRAFTDHPRLKVSVDGFVAENGMTFGLGDDVTKLLDVEKYETPIPASLSGQVKGMFPGFVKKTDEERIQNLPEYFDRFRDLAFECTEKIDGTSMTVYRNDGDVGVCSRNLDLLEEPSNTLWKTTRDLELLELLDEMGRNLALQGELAGEGIQKNPLKIRGQKYFLFNIWDIDKKAYLEPEERREIFEFLKQRAPIEHVPVVEENTKVFEKLPTMETMLEAATDKSRINNQVYREGVVFKSHSMVGAEVISFKAISNKYLLKHSL
jgi:RNA ligase (TIGR02306 family)